MQPSGTSSPKKIVFTIIKVIPAHLESLTFIHAYFYISTLQPYNCNMVSYLTRKGQIEKQNSHAHNTRFNKALGDFPILC